MASTRSSLHLALAGLLVLDAGPAAAAGLSCPVGAQPPPDGALFEAISKPGAAAGSNQALRAAVARLRGAGLSNGAIVDHTVASYCPRIARDDSLTLPEKRAALRDFAAQVTTLVYDPAQEETQIFLSVPVPTALSDQIDAAAAKAKVSRHAWIVRTLEAGVAGR